jgi:hypothetical protein
MADTFMAILRGVMWGLGGFAVCAVAGPSVNAGIIVTLISAVIGALP